MSFWQKIQAKFVGRPTQAAAPATESPTGSNHPASQVDHSAPASDSTQTKSGALDQVRQVIAVGSGKGGVGKSTVALNLAMSLAAEGAKVGLVDADIHGPSLQHMTGAERPTMAEGDRIEPPMYEGVKLISVGMFAAPGQAQLMRGPMVTQVIRQFLTQVNWGELDYLIIDLPPGTGDIHLSLAQMVQLSGAILVTTPQEISLIDVRKAVHMFQTVNVPVLGVVENMSFFICDSCDKKHNIFGEGGGKKLALEIGAPLLGQIPLDPRVGLAGDAGSAFVVQHHGAVLAQSYRDLAMQIRTQQTAAHSRANGALGYFLLEWK